MEFIISPIASEKIQIDRYSLKSETGACIDFLDSVNRFAGWKAILTVKNAWIQYNRVDFGSTKSRSIQVRVFSKAGGTLQIRLDNNNGAVIAQVNVPAGQEWRILTIPLLLFRPGIHNLVTTINDNSNAEIDWISFSR